MDLIETYKNYQKKLNNYKYALFIIEYDNSTICPRLDKEKSAEVSNFYKSKIIDITHSDEYFLLLKEIIKKHPQKDIMYLSIVKEYEDLCKEKNIPLDLINKGFEITSKATLLWENAQKNLDYSQYEAKLDELVDYTIKYNSFVVSKYSGYDICLDLMEKDYVQKNYDILFSRLEVEILPLLKKILAMPKKYNEKIKDLRFSVEKQKILTSKLCEIMGFNNDFGYVGESLHPFTNSINTNDVRITTKYDESLLFSNIYSIMHEVGHALYEAQGDSIYNDTYLKGGASCAIHESQSRFYENYLGRSKGFIKFLYPILIDLFPKLKDYSVDDIYYYCNDVCGQYYRTEADELTYPFHVLIRYKIEKLLLSKSISSSEISSVYNKLFYEYFNILPPNKKVGCFQDIHWCDGFGYFPTYVLGSAIAAMINDLIRNELDIDFLLENGNFKPINDWLKEKIHKYQRSLSNNEVIMKLNNRGFDSDYYINYLKEKFENIYLK